VRIDRRAAHEAGRVALLHVRERLQRRRLTAPPHPVTVCRIAVLQRRIGILVLVEAADKPLMWAWWRRKFAKRWPPLQRLVSRKIRL
jgi:hypothetical protein